MSSIIGQSDHFVLVFLHSVENRSIMCKRISVNWEQLLTPDYVHVRLLTGILCFCCKKNPSITNFIAFNRGDVLPVQILLPSCQILCDN